LAEVVLAEGKLERAPFQRIPRAHAEGNEQCSSRAE